MRLGSSLPITEILSRFVRSGVTLSELETRLAGVADFRYLDTNERSVVLLAPLPNIWFGAGDVTRVLEQFARGERTAREVSDWAATLRLLDCFDVTPTEDDADVVWEVVDQLASPDAWDALSLERAWAFIRRLA